ncbi:MAG: hypothetical protein HC835_03905 [Oscillatoriales cyanobacterium RM2_1_1]|nr:hypothetical protein [Oscillatoriales cyanobacterium SM2_3_0]NJO44827.1 hypothetical protein [Oscillatoriales cyanobacterium RM2_1_1]
MTQATSSPGFFPPFPEFAPYPSQDSDLLSQMGFLPGFKEILSVRQVHALEHATVWVLSELGTDSQGTSTESLGGMSTPEGFYLYGEVEESKLQQGAQIALSRLISGEWNLAVHPRCGTNLSVNLLLTGGLALGINSLLPKGPLEQLLGVATAATLANQIAPDLGLLAQQYVTTAVPFNLEIDEIIPAPATWGRPTHFVKVHWRG